MTIDLVQDGAVAEIVLNRPQKLNTLDEAALAELDDALQRAEGLGVRALLLRGEGRAFCAGRDISRVDPAADDAEGFLGGIVTPVLQRLAAFPAPTFAAAQGASLGLGLGLLIATDVVYLGESARIGSPFANLGAVLDSGGHALFVERLGAHRTLDLAYTGELMTGAEAVAAGLFSRVLPDGDLLAFTRDRAARAAAGATASFLASKRIVQRIRDERVGLWTVLADENAAQGALGQGPDYREGFTAFQQKRTPSFVGR